MVATEKLPSFQVRLRNPHYWQRRILESDKKRINIRAGRRGGKTVGIATRTVDRFVRLRRRQLYAVPSAEQLTRWWFEVVRALADPIEKNILKKDETKHIIELPGTEMRIRGKTAWNADMLRGDYADDLYLDEFQLMDETALTEVGLPMLMDNNGDLVIIYTPPSARSRSSRKASDPQYAPKLYRAMSLGYESVEEWMQDGMPATPRPPELFSPNVETLHWTTYDNPNISREGIENVRRSMTELAWLQEGMAEDITEVPGAIWKRETLVRNRRPAPPRDLWKRVVIAIDPAATSRKTSDETGLGAACLAPCACQGVEENHVFILDDRSGRYAPSKWAETALDLYESLTADLIVGEVNNGGEMVERTIRTIDVRKGERAPRRGQNARFKAIHASRGKMIRAEPVAALDEQGKVHHVREFRELEEQMCSFTGDSTKHDDRVDWRVYACTELMPNDQPFIRFGWA